MNEIQLSISVNTNQLNKILQGCLSRLTFEDFRWNPVNQPGDFYTEVIVKVPVWNGGYVLFRGIENKVELTIKASRSGASDISHGWGWVYPLLMEAGVTNVSIERHTSDWDNSYPWYMNKAMYWSSESEADQHTRILNRLITKNVEEIKDFEHLEGLVQKGTDIEDPVFDEWVEFIHNFVASKGYDEIGKDRFARSFNDVLAKVANAKKSFV